MIILKEISTTQEFKIIPRANEATSIVIKGSEGSETISFTPSFYSYYMVVSGIFNLKEGRQYSFDIMNNSDIVYKGRIFCTNQDINNYSINNGDYTETSSDNDFIIL
tara:strand:- start:473 stop:793 length:321 start_codon:yes stop_codon:yes gene_type:complete